MAEVSMEGNVAPAPPSGFPIFGGSDRDNNGVVDYLFPGGNGPITDGINGTDPSGTVGIGLAWNSSQVWRAFKSSFCVISGIDSRGSLIISAGGNIRIMHLVAGLTPNAYGDISVTGFGSLISNDYDSIPLTSKQALALAINPTSPNIGAVTRNDMYTNKSSAFPNVVPPPPLNANAWIGRHGYGTLNITAGGAVEIRHRLFVAGYEQVDEDEYNDGDPIIIYYIDPEGPVGKLNNIQTIGDIETFVDGEGGAVVINGIGSMLTVVGRTASNDPIPPQSSGTTEANEEQNQYYNQTEMTASQALPSVIGTAGVLNLSGGGAARFGAGLQNNGTILISGSATAVPNTIAIDPPFDENSPTPTLENKGLIVIRSGSILTVNGPIHNLGTIYCESGAILNTPDGITGPGQIKRSPCCPAAIRLDKKIVRLPKQCAVDII